LSQRLMLLYHYKWLNYVDISSLVSWLSKLGILLTT